MMLIHAAGRGATRVVALVVIGALAGCGVGPKEPWKPGTPAAKIDLKTFTATYRPVIESVASATADSGFTWSAQAPTTAKVNKNGLCSWRLQKTGTWARGAEPLREVRNHVNRAMVQNGFHATAWDDSSGNKVMTSVDKRNALLEVTVANPATIEIYSPAADATC